MIYLTIFNNFDPSLVTFDKLNFVQKNSEIANVISFFIIPILPRILFKISQVSQPLILGYSWSESQIFQQERVLRIKNGTALALAQRLRQELNYSYSVTFIFSIL